MIHKLKIILFLFCISLNAQNNRKTLLWKVSGKELSNPSYIFGTIHITCDSTLSGKVKKAMNETQQLCLELDMDDPNMQTQMMSKVMMKNGVTMESLLTKAEFELLDKYLLDNTGFSAKMMNTIKPFMVSAMFYTKMIDCTMYSVESELMKIAKKQNEEIIGLETVAEQMGVFDEIPYQEQMNELMKTIQSNLSKDKTELKKVMDAYYSEDIDAMVKVSEESENVITSKYKDVIMTKRNKNWIDRIIKIAKLKSTLFGVGAGHLGGEEGVINLLQKAGYKVDPIY